MVDRDVLAAKLAELADRVARVRLHCPASADALDASRDLLDLVSFNLMLAVQACADLATHTIADHGWPAARDVAGAFRVLEEHGVLSPAVARALALATGLRNVVAHVYAEVDTDLVFRAATEGLADLERFAGEISAWSARQP